MSSVSRISGSVAIAVLAFACGGAAVHAVAAPTPSARPSTTADPVSQAPKPPAEPLRVHLARRDGGWTVAELCAAATSATGRPILLDRAPSGALRQRIESTADIDLSGPKLFAWIQAALYAKRLVLRPMGGPECADGAATWQLMDECDPVGRQAPVVIDVADIGAYADRTGLLVMTTIPLAEGVDSTQMRNALCPISTQTAGIGRIQDVPGCRAVVIVDYAPIVAAMKRTIDDVGAAAPPKPRPRPD
jgi:hypothetical protein